MPCLKAHPKPLNSQTEVMIYDVCTKKSLFIDLINLQPFHSDLVLRKIRRSVAMLGCEDAEHDSIYRCVYMCFSRFSWKSERTRVMKFLRWYRSKKTIFTQDWDQSWMCFCFLIRVFVSLYVCLCGHIFFESLVLERYKKKSSITKRKNKTKVSFKYKKVNIYYS